MLEAAVSSGGALEALTTPGLLPSSDQVKITQQAMLVRPFPVDDPVLQTLSGSLPCSYVVHYLGPAEDLNLWLAHYIAGHPPIMRRFPGIRGLEILSRVDWCGTLPFERVAHMQRNRIVFDSAEALTAALHSPVRHEMRADYRTFPPFKAGTAHYPMATETVRPLNP
ncbi:MAG: ethyl tert-butyl ether degradation protein EthD [Burkholderiales bacterium]|nr:ethyl tert-butyl ether degradation protein EthD [Burkholderiales bacterium]